MPPLWPQEGSSSPIEANGIRSLVLTHRLVSSPPCLMSRNVAGTASVVVVYGVVRCTFLTEVDRLPLTLDFGHPLFCGRVLSEIRIIIGFFSLIPNMFARGTIFFSHFSTL